MPWAKRAMDSLSMYNIYPHCVQFSKSKCGAGGDRWGGGGDRGGGGDKGGFSNFGRRDEGRRDGGSSSFGFGGDRGGGGGGDRWGGSDRGGGGGDRWGGSGGGGGDAGGVRRMSGRERDEVLKLFETSRNKAGINFDAYDDM
jgi:CspA family cold shock protein